MLTHSPYPKHFAWGISSSSYQTEDPAISEQDPFYFKTDWDLYYEKGLIHFPKGAGTFSFTEYERDIQALKSIGVTHYRFSVEWARVEPKPGHFNEAALNYYSRFAQRLIQENIVPIVTFWHFTFPSWLTDLQKKSRHGWLHPDIQNAWTRYVRKIVERLVGIVTHFAPQNEPNTQSMAGFLAKLFPPYSNFSPVLYYQNMKEAARAFRGAAAIIRELIPSSTIITIQNLVYWQKSPFDLFKLFYSYAKDYNYFHLDRVYKEADWIGFTYYMGENASPLSLLSHKKNNGHHVSDLGWPICPEGLKELIGKVQRRYHKPVIIMENGIADAGDLKRQKFLSEHIQAMRESLEGGYDVRGYLHWSLIDNYEWAYGYAPKFGLFSLNEQSKQIIAKPSAQKFRDIITGSLMSPIG